MNKRKQSITHEDFAAMLAETPTLVSRDQFERLVATTAAEVKSVIGARRAGYAWSGGKDSLALEIVMNAAGVHSCCIGLTAKLEYHAFESWLALHRPLGLVVYRTPWDLNWLRRHPEMLFCADNAIRPRWYNAWLIAQKKFAKDRALDVLITGKRKMDGNVIFAGDDNRYRSGGIERYAPLWNWTHHDVFAALIYREPSLPPFYHWPRGWRVGTHAWPARRAKEHAQGWSECFAAEPDRVYEAAEAGIESAKRWLDNRS